MSKTMINNGSSFSDDDVMNYLAGYTTKLNGLIAVTKTTAMNYHTNQSGVKYDYYTNVVVSDTKLN
jgi:hypothetical protein